MDGVELRNIYTILHDKFYHEAERVFRERGLNIYTVGLKENSFSLTRRWKLVEERIPLYDAPDIYSVNMYVEIKAWIYVKTYITKEAGKRFFFFKKWKQEITHHEMEATIWAGEDDFRFERTTKETIFECDYAKTPANT